MNKLSLEEMEKSIGCIDLFRFISSVTKAFIHFHSTFQIAATIKPTHTTRTHIRCVCCGATVLN